MPSACGGAVVVVGVDGDGVLGVREVTFEIWAANAKDRNIQPRTEFSEIYPGLHTSSRGHSVDPPLDVWFRR
jgi:hypothetical protein